MTTSDNENHPIRIDKGVPIPQRGDRNWSKYPWADMEVGDSFLFPEGMTSNACHQAAANVRTQKPLQGRKFIVRKMPSGRLRCWRTA